MPDILYIGNRLEKHGVSPTSADILPAFFNELGLLTVTSSSKKNKILRLIDITWNLLKYAPKSRYVLIDTYSTINYWVAFWSGLICYFFKVKYIPILRGGNLSKRLDNNSFSSDFLFNHSYVNIAPSHYFLDLFKSYGIKNLKYIPNSIEIKRYNFKHRKELHPRILWVRAFDEIYRPELAMDVLELLLKDYPEAELCMVGPNKDGSLARLQKLAWEKELPVVFKGKLSKSEWTALSADYDIFINTTSVDNTPVSVIEAMALGLPVVSTNVGGLPYLLEHDHNGILVEPDNPTAMATAIIRLIKEPELAQKISLNGRKMVEKYDWENVKTFWLELLAEK